MDLQVLVVRGVIGLSSLMAGEVDVTCHAESGLAAALPGLPIKIINVTQKKLAVRDAKKARRMYDEDHQVISLNGVLNADAAREILDTAREALRIKETVPLERVFDFSLALEAMR